MISLHNSLFLLGLSERGALTDLSVAGDSTGMNFILNSRDEAWLPEKMQWGLGFVTVNGRPFPFSEGKLAAQSDSSVTFEHVLRPVSPRFGCVWNGDIARSRAEYLLRVSVCYALREDGLYERYEFFNDSPRYLLLDELGIYSGFYDTYAVGEDILSRRATEHIWAGGDLSWIAAVRQNGRPPHVGLITTQGRADGYHVDAVSTSNVRGAVALVGYGVRIPAGGTYVVSRVILPFESQEAFERLISERTGFPRLDCGRMTVEQGEPVELTLRGDKRPDRICLDGFEGTEEGGRVRFAPLPSGPHTCRVHCGDRVARMNFYVLPPIRDLLEARAEYIIERQQVRDPEDPLFGAYMPYDTERERILRLCDVEDAYYSVPDRNEARERLAMGAFLARWYRGRSTERALRSLRAYSDFLERMLIDENDDIWDCYLHQEAAKYYGNGLTLVQNGELDMRFRSCNLGFFAAFYYEMTMLTGEDRYYDRLIRLIDAAYRRYGHASGLGMWRFDALKEMRRRGDTRSASRLLAQLKEETDRLRASAESFSAGEVAYEQGNSANGTTLLCEMYLLEQDESLIPAIEHQLRLMETFEGNQPDYRLRHIPVRHWDGFWFGLYELWGDTMPHYWDTASAYAHARYALVSGDMRHMDRAKEIFYANLSLIQPCGAPSNLFIYPDKVDGRPGRTLDPIANDQDYAWYFYLKIFGKEVGCAQTAHDDDGPAHPPRRAGE